LPVLAEQARDQPAGRRLPIQHLRPAVVGPFAALRTMKHPLDKVLAQGHMVQAEPRTKQHSKPSSGTGEVNGQSPLSKSHLADCGPGKQAGFGSAQQGLNRIVRPRQPLPKQLGHVPVQVGGERGRCLL
jgi:hypothetical protein